MKSSFHRENWANSYYPFGSPMPGRSFTGATGYGYGYQVSLKDDEITGSSGSHYTTEFRELDTRLARWWSIDPETSDAPWNSPYNSMGNTPIWHNDILGNTDDKATASNPNTTESLHAQKYTGAHTNMKIKATEKAIVKKVTTGNGEVLNKENVQERQYDVKGGTNIPQVIQTTDNNGNPIPVTVNMGTGFASDQYQTPDNKISPVAVQGLMDGLKNANCDGAGITSVEVSATSNAHHDNAMSKKEPNWYKSKSNHYERNGAAAIDISKINGATVSKNNALMLQNAMNKVPSIKENYGPKLNFKNNIAVGDQGHNTWIHVAFK